MKNRDSESVVKEVSIKNRGLNEILTEMRLMYGGDTEYFHPKADELLCEALIITSKQELATPWFGCQIVEMFNRLEKWYA